MAKKDDEHRMLFDLRGRRRNVIKVIYAVLAVLMGASLFLIGTGSGIGPLFNDGSTGNSELIERYEDQIERTERKLAKNPNDANLLLTLTRTHLSAGDAMAEADSATGAVVLTPDSLQQYQEASDSWTRYLKATDEPSVTLATLIAPRFFNLAESQSSIGPLLNNLEAAREAQEIVAEQRPTLNSLSTLAIYQLFNFDYKAAKQTRAEAEKLTNSKSEEETLDSTLDEYEKNARQTEKSIKAAEKAAPAGAPAGEAALQQPLGGLGGSSLSE